MTTRWATLAEYDRPPVTETILATGFRSLPGLDSIRILDFWREHLRDQLPVALERPAHDSPVERLDRRRGQPPGAWTLGRRAVGSRLWFTNAESDELLQLQDGWLARNWRKHADTAYRRYESGRKSLEEVWGLLSRFVTDEGIGDLTPTQCDITYVNHIRVADGGWASHAEAHRLTALAGPLSPSVLPAADSQRHSASYPIDDDGVVGRLHVTFEPAFDEDDSPMFVMTLTARGPAPTPDLPGLLQFLDIGHDWIVGAFDALTTSHMHDLWGRRERENDRYRH